MQRFCTFSLPRHAVAADPNKLLCTIDLSLCHYDAALDQPSGGSRRLPADAPSESPRTSSSSRAGMIPKDSPPFNKSISPAYSLSDHMQRCRSNPTTEPPARQEQLSWCTSSASQLLFREPPTTNNSSSLAYGHFSRPALYKAGPNATGTLWPGTMTVHAPVGRDQTRLGSMLSQSPSWGPCRLNPRSSMIRSVSQSSSAPMSTWAAQASMTATARQSGGAGDSELSAALAGRKQSRSFYDALPDSTKLDIQRHAERKQTSKFEHAMHGP